MIRDSRIARLQIAKSRIANSQTAKSEMAESNEQENVGFTDEENSVHMEILRLTKRFCQLRRQRGARVPKNIVQVSRGIGLRVERRQYERRIARQRKKEAKLIASFSVMDIGTRRPPT